jgi:hypothetical protein
MACTMSRIRLPEKAKIASAISSAAPTLCAIALSSTFAGMSHSIVTFARKPSLQYLQAALCHSASPPSSGHKAEARIAAPDCFRTDVCVMPFTRPAEISNGVSLSDKVGRSEVAFVSEHGAVDALLAGIVDELSPNKHGVSVSGSENDVFAGADKLTALSSVSVFIAAVVPFIELQAT